MYDVRQFQHHATYVMHGIIVATYEQDLSDQ